MYKAVKKKENKNLYDDIWEKYGNPNIKNTKTKALDDKYWVNHK